MKNEEIKQLLLEQLPLQEVFVQSDDGSHFLIIAVSAAFESMSRIEKQQFIYKPLMNLITSNIIHAVSIQAFTPEQWQKERKLRHL